MNVSELLLNDTNIYTRVTIYKSANKHNDVYFGSGFGGGEGGIDVTEFESFNNWWALLALVLVVGTAAGNILVCLAITWERRLQNVTNYFLMSLAITDLMVAMLVMPLGILTLVKGHFPLPSIYCLAWICLDVLFCTASIMHLCTISVDRYLSLRYPMKFGRNKSRRRVTLKIIFVWLLSIAMSLPLSLMYSKNHDSVLIDGDCQIPDPLYKFVGSIICFYIPLIVMLLTYALTVRLLAEQSQNLGTPDWSSGWMGGPTTTPLDRRCTWRKLLKATRGGNSRPGSATPQHGGHHSATSTDTELTTIDTHELWIQESEPSQCTMSSALGQFGAEMLKLSRGLEAASRNNSVSSRACEREGKGSTAKCCSSERDKCASDHNSPLLSADRQASPWLSKRRRASTFHEGDTRDESPTPRWRRRGSSFNEKRSTEPTAAQDSCAREADEAGLIPLPPPCTCPYFGHKRDQSATAHDVKASASVDAAKASPAKRSMLSKVRGANNAEAPSANIVVTWESSCSSSSRRSQRRGSSFGSARSAALSTNQRAPFLLRRAATLRHNGTSHGLNDRNKNPSSPCLLQRYNYNSSSTSRGATIRSHHSRNSSVISRNSSRHGRIIRLEQKATKVLGVVFFTFVILWAPFFVLNLLPIMCGECERHIDGWVFHFVTWLGYASSLVNPIFYTIFNKVFRQAFKKVLLCKYRNPTWRPHR